MLIICAGLSLGLVYHRTREGLVRGVLNEGRLLQHAVFSLATIFMRPTRKFGEVLAYTRSTQKVPVMTSKPRAPAVPLTRS